MTGRDQRGQRVIHSGCESCTNWYLKNEDGLTSYESGGQYGTCGTIKDGKRTFLCPAHKNGSAPSSTKARSHN